MKFIQYLSLFIMAVVTSCSTNSDEIIPENEINGLIKIQTMENNSHALELFSESGELQEGYNKIVLRLKDKSDGEFVTDVEIEWNPLMQMQSMQHSAPKSVVSKAPETQTLYEGYIVFQMAENQTEFWNLSVDYTIDGEVFTMEDKLFVSTSERRKVNVFTGTDGVKYILALIEPKNPEVATNNISSGLFKMESMNSFTIVDNYRILIDPRMPAMGNHSSPNNVDLIQEGADIFYHGKLNLTMTGYWKINLQLENSAGEVVKGEPVEGTTESSSIFFELEF